jgi:hypothetical protein
LFLLQWIHEHSDNRWNYAFFLVSIIGLIHSLPPIGYQQKILANPSNGTPSMWRLYHKASISSTAMARAELVREYELE